MKIFTTQQDDNSTYIYFNYTFEKKKLKELITWFSLHYGEKTTFFLLEVLKIYGYQKATQSGISLNLDDLNNENILKFKKNIKFNLNSMAILNIQGNLKSLDKVQMVLHSWNITNEKILKELSINLKKKDSFNPITLMAFSGARGNLSQVRQLMGMRGLMADASGSIIELPIQNNFKNGISLIEYFISCYGARKGVIDTALRTAKAGYLTRRLVFIVQHLVITKFDCFTTEGFWTFFPLQDKKQEDLKYLGRALLKTNSLFLKKKMIISPSLIKILNENEMNTKVAYRSTLTCILTQSICQLCYGWDCSTGNLIEIGEAIGICAGQAIGEPGTQLTMRTFHTGGVGVLSTNKQYFIRAPFDGIIHFHNIENIMGNIVFVPGMDLQKNFAFLFSKKITSGFQSFFDTEVDTEVGHIRHFKFLEVNSNNQNSFYIYKDQLPHKSLLFVQQDEKVQKGQILVQVSPLKDESLELFKYPIDYKEMKLNLNLYRAPLEGEISLMTNFTNLRYWISSSKIVEQFPIDFDLKFHDSPLKLGDYITQKTIFLEQQYFSPVAGQLYTLPSLTKNLKNFYISHIKQNIFYMNIGSHYILNKNKLFYWINKKKNISWFQFKMKNVDPNFKKIDIFDKFKKIYFNSQKETFLSKIWIFKTICIYNNYNFSNWLKYTDLQVSLFFHFKFKHKFRYRKNKKNIFYSFSKNFWYSEPPFSQQNEFFFEKFIEQVFHYKIKLKNNFLQNENILRYSIKNPIWIKQGKTFFLDKEPYDKYYYHEMNRLNYFFSMYYISFFPKIKNDFFFHIKTYKKDRELISFFYTSLYEKKFSIFSYKDDFLDIYKPAKIYLDNFILKKNIFLYNQNHIFCNDKYFIINKSDSIEKNGLKQNFKIKIYPYIKKVIYKQNLKLIQKKQKINLNLKLLELKIKYLILYFLCILNYSYQIEVLYYFIKIRGIFIRNLKKKDYIPLKDIKHLKRKYYSYIITECSFQLILLKKLQIAPSLSNLEMNDGFKVFKNRWIFPNQEFVASGQQIEHSGEIKTINFDYKNRYVFSILDYNSIATIGNLNKITNLTNLGYLGIKILYGDILSIFPSNLVFPLNGQIIKKTEKNFIINKGSPYFFKNTIKIEDTFIKKENVLSFYYSIAQKTQDITQGIPKIEKFFEARNISEIGSNEVLNSFYTSIATYGLFKLLKNRNIGYIIEDRTKGLFEQLSRSSINILQIFYVEKIIHAYRDQGVDLNEKHIELIVREMTNKVEILDGISYGFIPGEYYNFQFISQLNKLLFKKNQKEIIYSPIALGLTWSTKRSTSFLVAVAFQEILEILTTRSVRNQNDYLLGLHENLLLERSIPAGSGLFIV